MSEITTRLSADASEYNSVLTQAEGRAQTFNANLQKLGFSDVVSKSAKESAAALDQLLGAQDRLAAAQSRRALESSAGHSQEIILQREIIALNQQLATIEDGTAEKLRVQIALEEKQLQLERSIASARSTGGGGAAGGLREAASAAREADAATGAFGKQLGKVINVGQAVKAVLSGIGLAMFAPDAADKLARLITGVSKKEEEALKQLSALSDQVTEKQMAAMRARLSDEQLYQSLLGETERLSKRIAEATPRTTEEQVKLGQDKLRLLDAEKESAEVLKRIEESRAQKAKEAGEEAARLEKMRADYIEKVGRLEDENLKRSLEKMSVTKQVQTLEQSLLSLQSERNKYAQGTAERADLERRIRTRAREVEDAISAAHKATNLSAAEQIELSTLLQKQKVGGLNPAEADRLRILNLQTQQLATQSELAPLLEKGYRNLTPEEQKRFDALVRENAEIEKQIALVNAVKDEVAKIAPAIESNISAWEKFKIAINTTGRGDAALSDAELQKKIDNLQQDIFRRRLTLSQQTGFNFIGGDLADPLLSGVQKPALDAALAEQRRRDDTRSLVEAFGETRAFQMFSGSLQEFKDILSGITEQQQLQRDSNNALTSLANWVKQGAPTTVLNPRG